MRQCLVNTFGNLEIGYLILKSKWKSYTVLLNR